MKASIFNFLAVVATLATATTQVTSQGFEAPKGVDYLDVAQYTGGWYETVTTQFVHDTIEFGCSCSQTYYTLKPNSTNEIDVTNACRRFGRQWELDGTATQLKVPQYPGQFYVNFPSTMTYYQDNSTANYIVMKIWRSESGDYQQALVGSSDPRMWWLISRTPVVHNQNITKEAIKLAGCYGFNTTNLHYSDQSQCTWQVSRGS